MAEWFQLPRPSVVRSILWPWVSMAQLRPVIQLWVLRVQSYSSESDVQSYSSESSESRVSQVSSVVGYKVRGSKLQFSYAQLQIYDGQDYGCSKFHFCREIPKMGKLQPQILHFWKKIFRPSKIAPHPACHDARRHWHGLPVQVLKIWTLVRLQHQTISLSEHFLSENFLPKIQNLWWKSPISREIRGESKLLSTHNRLGQKLTAVWRKIVTCCPDFLTHDAAVQHVVQHEYYITG